MGMVAAQHIAHARGGFLEGLIHREAVFIHGIENPAVHRLQSVPHIRQGPAHNDAHGVFNIGFLHLGNQRGDLNLLIGIPDFLRIVLGFLTHIGIPPLIVQIDGVLGVLFNKFLPGLHLFAH